MKRFVAAAAVAAVAAGDVLVELDNVPDSADIPLLCRNVAAFYSTIPPVTLYCTTTTNWRTTIIGKEILTVTFLNLTSNTSSFATPTALNAKLTLDGFDGTVKMVSPITEYKVLVSAVMGSVTGVIILGALIILFQ